MKRFSLPVLVGTVLLAILIAIANNLVNSHSVPWIGSPEILEKPAGWPSLSPAQGMLAGCKVAWKMFLSHQAAIWMALIAMIAVMLFLKFWKKTPYSMVLRSALRIGLSAMFLAAAWPKFMDPKDFATLVAQYQFLPTPLVNPFTLWLSSFEMVVGLGILLSPWEKEFSALIGLLMVMFIIALGQALHRDLGIACGCFDIAGAADAGETWFSLLRDVVLLIPIAWMIRSGGKRFLLKFSATRYGMGGKTY